MSQPDGDPSFQPDGGDTGNDPGTGTIGNLPTPTGTGDDPLSIDPTNPFAPQSSTPSSAPWAFEPVNNTETCEPIMIAWDVSSSSQASDNFDATLQFTLMSKTNASLSIDLTTSQPMMDIPFVATNVSVPAGSYYIRGRDTTDGFFQTSEFFDVITGSNTKCLDSGTNSSSSPIATTSSGPASASSGSSTSTRSGSSKTAVIVGSTVGGIAALGLLILGALWFILSRRNHHSSGPGRKRHVRGGWGGLDSVEYKPTSAVLGAGTHTAAPRRSTSTSGSIVKDADKLDVPAAAVAVAAEHPDSATSLSSLGYDHPARLPQGYPPVRSPSLTSSLHSHEMTRLPASPTTPQPPAVAKAVGRSLDSRSGTPSTLDPFTPTATTATNSGNNKRSSRTQRKPVPAYEPTPEELAQLVLARSLSESGTYFSGGSSSKSSSRTPSFVAATNAPIPASFGSASPLSSSPQALAMLKNLKSKSSGHFAHGDSEGNVHYLMPDPPMSPRG